MKNLILIISLSCMIIGCSIFDAETFVDSNIDKNGQLLLSDTERNWVNYRETVDFRIVNELAGKRPEAGKKTWNEFWLWSIEAQKTGRENREKYIKYIINARRIKGLPELENGI